MKYLCSGEKKFRLRSLMIFCTAFLLLSAVCPSIAMANYQSSLFSTVHDGQIVTYNSGSASHFESPSVVRLADNRLLVVFDLELELATNAANGGAADGVSFTASKLARKFSFGGSDNPPNILNIAPHTYTYAIDGVLRTFSAFEIVTEDALSPTVTLSYDPAFEEEDSFVFAVPSQQSLLSGFPAVSPAPLDAALTKIEIGDALLGVDSRIIFDDADPQITDQAYACFEVVLSDDIPKTTITFTPSDNTTLWTTDFGAPPNGIGETTNEIDLNPGVNKATITLGTGENAIPYTIFIIRGANSAPALKNLNLITMIKATQGQGPVVPYVPGEELAIPLTQGQLAYHTNFQSTVLGVKVAPEADAGVSVFVNGVLLQGDTSEVIELSIDTVNKITIGLVDAEDHTTTYSLYITRGNEAILSGLKLTKIDESEQGAGASPYIEVPIRHVNSDENGYIQDGERDASGWQQYVADANRPGSFAGVEFYLEPTFNADTRVFVSNVKKTTLDPADEVKSDDEGVYRSKPFVINDRGEELTLYLTMFRQEPGGTDWIMSDSAVAVSVVTEPVKSKLTKITVTDGYTSEDLLILSGDELMVSTQNSITTSQFAKFIHIEIAKEGSDLLLTPVNFQGTPVGGSGFRADVKFSAYGEEKELIIETVDRQTGDAKSYKLNVTQGHPPFVILGMSPDAVFQQTNPSMLILDMNGLPREGMYDMETRQPIHTVKVPSLPSRTDADGNTVLTVDWTICPPSADLDVDFYLIEYERSGIWRMENIRGNADSSGGTLDVVLQNKNDAPYCFRTYSDKTCVRLHNFGLRATLSKRGIGELDDYYGDFAMVTPDFAEITIEVLNQSEVIIKSEKDRYPEDKRLPIVDFKLWGISDATMYQDKVIGLQVGRTYKIPIVYSGVTTYGDYREYVRKKPDMGERYPYVFAPGDTAPIPVLLEDLRSRNVPGYSPNMMDDRPLEFSHDKIKLSISHRDSNLWYVKVGDYFHIDQEAGTITVLKGNSGTFILYATTERLGEVRTVYVETINADATKIGTGGYLSYVSIYPQLVYFGFDGAYKLNPGYDGYDLTKTPIMSIWDMRVGSNAEIGRVVYNNIPKHALKTIHSSRSYTGADLRWYFWKGEGWDARKETLEPLWQDGQYWRNSETSGNHPFGFNIRRYFPKKKEIVIEELEFMLKVSGLLYTELVSPLHQAFLGLVREFMQKTVELSGPYDLKLEVRKEHIDKADRGDQLVPTLDANIIVICTDPAEDSNSPKSSADLSRKIMATAAGRVETEDDEVRELDLSSFEYEESPSGDAFLLTDGYTAFSMSYSTGSSEGTPVTADEIEWAVPIIPGAQTIQVGDFDGVPVSSDYSLFLEEAKKPKGMSAASARGASSGEAPNASFQIRFSAPKTDLANMEFFDFYFKLKGDDTIYSAPPEGTGENGGVRLHPYYLEAEQQAQKANSGSGCSAAGTVGTVTLLSLTGASLLFAGKRRKK